MAKNLHRIKKLQVQMQFSGKSDAWNSEELVRRVRRGLESRLEPVLDEVAGPDSLLYLPELVLTFDLGESVDSESFAERVATQLKEVLDERKRNLSKTESVEEPSEERPFWKKDYMAGELMTYLRHGYVEDSRVLDEAFKDPEAISETMESLNKLSNTEMNRLFGALSYDSLVTYWNKKAGRNLIPVSRKSLLRTQLRWGVERFDGSAKGKLLEQRILRFLHLLHKETHYTLSFSETRRAVGYFLKTGLAERDISRPFYRSDIRDFLDWNRGQERKERENNWVKSDYAFLYDDFDVLQYYLEHKRLPSWSGLIAGNIAEILVKGILSSQHGKERVREFFGKLRTRNQLSFFGRWAKALGIDVFRNLVEVVGTASARSVDRLMRLRRTFQRGGFLSGSVDELIKEQLFAFATGAGTRLDAPFYALVLERAGKEIGRFVNQESPELDIFYSKVAEMMKEDDVDTKPGRAMIAGIESYSFKAWLLSRLDSALAGVGKALETLDEGSIPVGQLSVFRKRITELVRNEKLTGKTLTELIVDSFEYPIFVLEEYGVMEEFQSILVSVGEKGFDWQKAQGEFVSERTEEEKKKLKILSERISENAEDRLRIEKIVNAVYGLIPKGLSNSNRIARFFHLVKENLRDAGLWETDFSEKIQSHLADLYVQDSSVSVDFSGYTPDAVKVKSFVGSWRYLFVEVGRPELRDAYEKDIQKVLSENIISDPVSAHRKLLEIALKLYQPTVRELEKWETILIQRSESERGIKEVFSHAKVRLRLVEGVLAKRKEIAERVVRKVELFINKNEVRETIDSLFDEIRFQVKKEVVPTVQEMLETVELRLEVLVKGDAEKRKRIKEVIQQESITGDSPKRKNKRMPFGEVDGLKTIITFLRGGVWLETKETETPDKVLVQLIKQGRGGQLLGSLRLGGYPIDSINRLVFQFGMESQKLLLEEIANDIPKLEWIADQIIYGPIKNEKRPIVFREYVALVLEFYFSDEGLFDTDKIQTEWRNKLLEIDALEESEKLYWARALSVVGGWEKPAVKPIQLFGKELEVKEQLEVFLKTGFGPDSETLSELVGRLDESALVEIMESVGFEERSRFFLVVDFETLSKWIKKTEKYDWAISIYARLESVSVTLTGSKETGQIILREILSEYQESKDTEQELKKAIQRIKDKREVQREWKRILKWIEDFDLEAEASQQLEVFETEKAKEVEPVSQLVQIVINRMISLDRPVSELIELTLETGKGLELFNGFIQNGIEADELADGVSYYFSEAQIRQWVESIIGLPQWVESSAVFFENNEVERNTNEIFYSILKKAFHKKSIHLTEMVWEEVLLNQLPNESRLLFEFIQKEKKGIVKHTVKEFRVLSMLENQGDEIASELTIKGMRYRLFQELKGTAETHVIYDIEKGEVELFETLLKETREETILGYLAMRLNQNFIKLSLRRTVSSISEWPEKQKSEVAEKIERAKELVLRETAFNYWRSKDITVLFERVLEGASEPNSVLKKPFSELQSLFKSAGITDIVQKWNSETQTSRIQFVHDWFSGKLDTLYENVRGLVAVIEKNKIDSINDIESIWFESLLENSSSKDSVQVLFRVLKIDVREEHILAELDKRVFEPIELQNLLMPDALFKPEQQEVYQDVQLMEVELSEITFDKLRTVYKRGQSQKIHTFWNSATDKVKSNLIRTWFSGELDILFSNILTLASTLSQKRVSEKGDVKLDTIWFESVLTDTSIDEATLGFIVSLVPSLSGKVGIEDLKVSHFAWSEVVQNETVNDIHLQSISLISTLKEQLDRNPHRLEAFTIDNIESLFGQGYSYAIVESFLRRDRSDQGNLIRHWFDDSFAFVFYNISSFRDQTDSEKVKTHVFIERALAYRRKPVKEFATRVFTEIRNIRLSESEALSVTKGRIPGIYWKKREFKHTQILAKATSANTPFLMLTDALSSEELLSHALSWANEEKATFVSDIRIKPIASLLEDKLSDQALLRLFDSLVPEGKTVLINILNAVKYAQKLFGKTSKFERRRILTSLLENALIQPKANRSEIGFISALTEKAGFEVKYIKTREIQEVELKESYWEFNKSFFGEEYRAWVTELLDSKKLFEEREINKSDFQYVWNELPKNRLLDSIRQFDSNRELLESLIRIFGTQYAFAYENVELIFQESQQEFGVNNIRVFVTAMLDGPNESANNVAWRIVSNQGLNKARRAEVDLSKRMTKPQIDRLLSIKSDFADKLKSTPFEYLSLSDFYIDSDDDYELSQKQVSERFGIALKLNEFFERDIELIPFFEREYGKETVHIYTNLVLVNELLSPKGFSREREKLIFEFLSVDKSFSKKRKESFLRKVWNNLKWPVIQESNIEKAVEGLQNKAYWSEALAEAKSLESLLSDMSELSEDGFDKLIRTHDTIDIFKGLQEEETRKVFFVTAEKYASKEQINVFSRFNDLVKTVDGRFPLFFEYDESELVLIRLKAIKGQWTKQETVDSLIVFIKSEGPTKLRVKTNLLKDSDSFTKDELLDCIAEPVAVKLLNRFSKTSNPRQLKDWLLGEFTYLEIKRAIQTPLGQDVSALFPKVFDLETGGQVVIEWLGPKYQIAVKNLTESINALVDKGLAELDLEKKIRIQLFDEVFNKQSEGLSPEVFLQNIFSVEPTQAFSISLINDLIYVGESVAIEKIRREWLSIRLKESAIKGDSGKVIKSLRLVSQNDVRSVLKSAGTRVIMAIRLNELENELPKLVKRWFGEETGNALFNLIEFTKAFYLEKEDKLIQRSVDAFFMPILESSSQRISPERILAGAFLSQGFGIPGHFFLRNSVKRLKPEEIQAEVLRKRGSVVPNDNNDSIFEIFSENQDSDEIFVRLKRLDLRDIVGSFKIGGKHLVSRKISKLGWERTITLVRLWRGDSFAQVFRNVQNLFDNGLTVSVGEEPFRRVMIVDFFENTESVKAFSKSVVLKLGFEKTDRFYERLTSPNMDIRQMLHQDSEAISGQSPKLLGFDLLLSVSSNNSFDSWVKSIVKFQPVEIIDAMSLIPKELILDWVVDKVDYAGMKFWVSSWYGKECADAFEETIKDTHLSIKEVLSFWSDILLKKDFKGRLDKLERSVEPIVSLPIESGTESGVDLLLFIKTGSEKYWERSFSRLNHTIKSQSVIKVISETNRVADDKFLRWERLFYSVSDQAVEEIFPRIFRADIYPELSKLIEEIDTKQQAWNSVEAPSAELKKSIILWRVKGSKNERFLMQKAFQYISLRSGEEESLLLELTGKEVRFEKSEDQLFDVRREEIRERDALVYRLDRGVWPFWFKPKAEMPLPRVTSEILRKWHGDFGNKDWVNTTHIHKLLANRFNDSDYKLFLKDYSPNLGVFPALIEKFIGQAEDSLRPVEVRSIVLEILLTNTFTSRKELIVEVFAYFIKKGKKVTKLSNTVRGYLLRKGDLESTIALKEITENPQVVDGDSIVNTEFKIFKPEDVVRYVFRFGSLPVFIEEKEVLKYIGVIQLRSLKSIIKSFLNDSENDKPSLPEIYGEFATKRIFGVGFDSLVRFDRETLSVLESESRFNPSTRSQWEHIAMLYFEKEHGSFMDYAEESVKIRLENVAVYEGTEYGKVLGWYLEKVSQAKIGAQQVAVSEKLALASSPPIVDESEELVNKELEEVLFEPKRPIPIPDGMLVKNSGLVILWPYMVSYFRKLDMLEGRHFKTKELAKRATHLMQFLVTGEEETPEYLMSFNKFLCGLPFDEPLEPEIEMTEKEKELALSMLNDIVERLSLTSKDPIRWFRQKYMKRNGILYYKEGWKLNVKEIKNDLVLSLLPWGFGMLQYPWMRKPLKVEWEWR
ncbi:hypothetical protein FUAX_24530 [Fulvitalea axinellae]|uniref:Uncharacterized protein n=1 Tax=Fulvitalea axinellae TaxID=1182444 RepID=A0AAU9CLY6_9BACT|nr:hypothetical protein FUAX_24530 [Fulvitalea axinellae]